MQTALGIGLGMNVTAHKTNTVFRVGQARAAGAAEEEVGDSWPGKGEPQEGNPQQVIFAT